MPTKSLLNLHISSDVVCDVFISGPQSLVTD